MMHLPTGRRCSILLLLLGAWALCLPGYASSARPVAKAKAHAVAHKAPVVSASSHRAAKAVKGSARGSRTSPVHAVVERRASRSRATERASSKRTRDTADTKAAVATRLVRGRHGRLVRVEVPARARLLEAPRVSVTPESLTLGDITAGEDPIVRAAAIEALGDTNGTAVAIDPDTGRVLALVNQKLALSSGAEPCSTIKLTVALAALQEGLVTRDTPVALGGSYHVTLTDALAHSNNLYFETLGRALGFERVKHYANQLGLGELAGYNIAGEQLGIYPDHELPQAMGGVGRMCSFGESVSMTPLQLGAIVAAIANGGTLFYLQHPETPEQVTAFEPRVKRTLDIANLIPEMQDGMQGAVNYGTARRLKASFTEFPVMGKTGTCSNNGTHFGWFGSYANTPNGRIVTVIFAEGGRPTSGPRSAELTGQFYRALYDKNYFMPHTPAIDSGGQTTR